MTEQGPTPTPAPAPEPSILSTPPTIPPPREKVGAGLLGATAAVLVGIVLTVAVWEMGFVASITSLLLAAGAVVAYTKLAGTPPRHGIVPLLLLILLGVVVSFFAAIATDAWRAYDTMGLDPAQMSRGSFVYRVVTDSEVLSEYTKDGLMFLLFAGLGLFGTFRRLMASRA